MKENKLLCQIVYILQFRYSLCGDDGYGCDQ